MSKIDENTKQAFNLLPTLIWSSDEDGNCLFVNDCWQEFTGLSLSDCLGGGWLKSFHKSELKKFKSIFIPNKAKVRNVEFRVKKADCSYAWMSNKYSEDKGVYTGILSDVTEAVERQEQVELDAQRTKDFLKSVIEGIPDPIFVKDEEHRWIEGNKAFFDILNMPREDVLHKSDYDFFSKEEADIFWKKDNEVFESGEVVDNFENLTQKGETKTFYTRKVVATDPDGKRILVGAIRDITELEKVKGRLEKAVEELTESNEDLERFAYVASHDLQEPLRMVINFTGLLEERYSEQLDDTAKKYISFASEAASHMEDLVDDLLEYARFNEAVERKVETNCEDLLSYVIKNLNESIEAESATITVINNLPILKSANPVRLSRVMQNILGNGIKYHEEGELPHIEISCKEVDGFWQFRISDKGIGIEEEYYERIFVPFKRLHSNEEFSGTGIGLAICKKIVESDGGKIWVDGVMGKGANFYFTIPKKQGDRFPS